MDKEKPETAGIRVLRTCTRCNCGLVDGIEKGPECNMCAAEVYHVAAK